MDRYGQYCPVARASEIFADRWTPLIMRELLEGIHHFNDLERGLPGISRSLLVDRLRRMEQTGVVVRQEDPIAGRSGYYLTSAGEGLKQVIDRLGAWGARWAFGDPRADELDPVLLLWWMRRRTNVRELPRRRIVVAFVFRGSKRQHLWLVLGRTDISVCLQHPGFDIDLEVRAHVADLYKVWLGRLRFADALDQDLIELDGSPALVRAFPRWFLWSPFAGAVHAAAIREAALAEARAG